MWEILGTGYDGVRNCETFVEEEIVLLCHLSTTCTLWNSVNSYCFDSFP